MGVVKGTITIATMLCDRDSHRPRLHVDVYVYGSLILMSFDMHGLLDYLGACHTRRDRQCMWALSICLTKISTWALIREWVLARENTVHCMWSVLSQIVSFALSNIISSHNIIALYTPRKLHQICTIHSHAQLHTQGKNMPYTVINGFRKSMKIQDHMG